MSFLPSQKWHPRPGRRGWLRTGLAGIALAAVVLFAPACQSLLSSVGLTRRAPVVGWPSDSEANLPICTAPGRQHASRVAADGVGGAFIAWVDERDGNADVYAHHVLASGTTDSTWPPDGRAVCKDPAKQVLAGILADGRGGVLLAWMDARGGAWNLRAQRLLRSGVFDPSWPEQGRDVAASGRDRTGLAVAGDGDGGAILAWLEAHDPGRLEVLAHRLRADGTWDPGWPPAGRVLGHVTLPERAHERVTLAIAADDSGGAFVVWDDAGRDSSRVHLRHVTASGATDPAPPDRDPPGGALGVQSRPTIVSDGTGGAIVAWDEEYGRKGIYLMRVRATGERMPGWPAGGVRASSERCCPSVPALLADGTGGAFVTWGGLGDHSVQHVLPTGVVDPSWPRDGNNLSHYHGDHSFTLVPDGSGGVIVTWSRELDRFTGNLWNLGLELAGDVHAEHILSSGVFDPAWKGQPSLTNAPRRQACGAAIADGAGGAIVVWEDWRSDIAIGGTYHGDIYAQRIGPDGRLGGTVVVR